MVSVMLYTYILCVDLLIDLFVLCVACLTVFVNCLMKCLMSFGATSSMSAATFTISKASMLQSISMIGSLISWTLKLY